MRPLGNKKANKKISSPRPGGGLLPRRDYEVPQSDKIKMSATQWIPDDDGV